MGYRKIRNLYRPEASSVILGRKEVYACEKIHGTSAHIAWNHNDGFRYFEGGINRELFLQMIKERFPNVEKDLLELVSFINPPVKDIVLYGEAYGGKYQKMSSIYGPLNFVVFEVLLNEEIWLSVPKANLVAESVNLPFVHFEMGPATIEWLNAQRDKPSEQAKRNGMGDDKYGEGIVVRTLTEELDKRGNRIIAKHKREVYGETKTPREIDPNKQKVWREARETAEEWVTSRRLEHVIDKLKANGIECSSMKDTNTVIREMISDVRIESHADSVANPEIKWSAAISKAIGAKAASIYKEYIRNQV